MDKIATPSDLITQLTSLQERVSSEPVSRDVVASELRALADKISTDKSAVLKFRNITYETKEGSNGDKTYTYEGDGWKHKIVVAGDNVVASFESKDIKIKTKPSRVGPPDAAEHLGYLIKDTGIMEFMSMIRMR